MDDFTDVFGGPPRTVLSREFSKSSSTRFFSDEIFRPPAKGTGGRILSEFKIPSSRRSENNGFYSDIFGSSSRPSSLSPAMSSKETSPLSRNISSVDRDDDVSLLAAKLRPIHVKWNSTGMGNEDHQRQKNIPPFQPIYNTENLYPFGSSRKIASPETISLDPISNGSFRVSSDNSGPNSPSYADPDEEILRQDFMEQEEDGDDDTSSYVIEINSDYREENCTELYGVDEAIAWAKEKCQTHGFETICKKDEPIEDAVNLCKWIDIEETPRNENKVQTEMQKLDEKLRVWSAYKEDDIRLLLHTILWPNSGWLEIPLINVIQSSQVKKAYQKARLCLHPDKLQQRGVTITQKYVADKAFAILQDAWAAFIYREDTVSQLRRC